MSVCPSCGKSFSETVRLCPNDGTVLETEGVEDPRIGTLLAGKYRLDAQAGKGGMGTVYKATHVMLGRTVAVKLINRELSPSADVVLRFQREARAAGRLDHPNIAKVHDLGQTDDGTLFIAMEYVEGTTLKDVVAREGRLAADRIVRLTTQIASALAAAHAQTIIHRDLKPQNIIVMRDNGGRETTKLLDFGIAKSLREDATQVTSTGLTLGTPQYMSPEQAQGRQLDGRSDLYSFGVILYEMLAGVVPFDDPSTPAVLIKHVSEAPPPPSSIQPGVPVPAGLEAITLKCLEKDPDRRFQSADELRLALESVSAEAATKVIGAAGVVMAGSADPPTVPLSQTGSGTPTEPIASAEPAAPTEVMPPTEAATVAASPPHDAPAAAPAADAETVAAGPVSDAPMPPKSSFGSLTSERSATAAGRGAVDAPQTTQSRSTGSSLVLAIIILVLIGGVGFGAYALGYLSAPWAEDETPTSTLADDQSVAPPDDPAGAQGPDVAQPASTPEVSAEDAGDTASPTASDPGTGVSGDEGTSAGQVMPPQTPPATPPATTPTNPAPPAQTAPPPPQEAAAAPALPEHPTVRFGCDGPAEVCFALQAELDQALGNASMPSVGDETEAHLLVDAIVSAGAPSRQQAFGTTFVIQPYRVSFSGVDRESSARLPMPTPTSFSLDERVGAERLTEQSRLMSAAVVERLRTYWASRR
jgi:serine/threonine-protein kinase